MKIIIEGRRRWYDDRSTKQTQFDSKRRSEEEAEEAIAAAEEVFLSLYICMLLEFDWYTTCKLIIDNVFYNTLST
jgi:hypothetical protein